MLSCGKDIDCLKCDGLAGCEYAASLVERYKKSVNEENRGQGSPHPDNRLNHLDGGQWLYFTKSLWQTAYPHEFSHHLRKQHGANKPPRLMQRLIEFFTREGEHVLDPFAGVGGTLIGAALTGMPRQCTGMEINPRWIDIYRQVLTEHPELRPYPVLEGDCLQLLEQQPPEKYHFIATDPPYNTHFKRTMCTGRYAEEHANRKTDYDMRSESKQDLANCSSYETYLRRMGEVFAQCYRVLVPGRYMAVILRNAYQEGRYIFTHADLARRAEAVGFVAKGEVVWYQAGTRLRPYGYPFAYVPNITHQFILILRRPK